MAKLDFASRRQPLARERRSLPVSEAPSIPFAGGLLRPLRASDAAAVYAYLSEPAVTALTSYPEVTLAFVDAMIARATSRWAEGELSKWALTLDGDDAAVGLCGFNEVSRPHRWAELAYDLSPALWGRGIARGAVQAALEWAFTHGEVDRVHAYVRDDNARSARLLERCGFTREGRLRRYRVCRGEARDFDVYALLRDEWERR